MDEFAEINITPFTDVLLVLLIIFMLMAALIAPAGFERQASQPSHATSDVAIIRAELVVAANGAMLLDGKRVDDRSIYPAMRGLRALHTKLALSIFGDHDAQYAHIVRAMDAAKDAGITDVSFVAM